METKCIAKELENNSYPGRGIIIGTSKCGKYAVIGYFIMGRSVNSRNRVFITEGEGIRTEAFDPSKLSDPSLVIYAPVKVLGETTVVTNGDQTDTVYDFLKESKTFEEALRTRCYEPDEPTFTPRISGVVVRHDNTFDYKLSILKSSEGNGDYHERQFFEYQAQPGIGHFIHTYKCDGNPRIPSFEGEPERIRMFGDIEEFTNTLWNSLNEDNKVSLFTRFINLETGETETRIINKNK